MKTTILLLLLISPVYSCDISDALQSIRPRSTWTLDGTSYDGLTWLDKVQTKPTQQEVLDAMATCQSSDLTRKAQKIQARLDVKNVGLTQAQRLQALLILLDLDK